MNKAFTPAHWAKPDGARLYWIDLLRFLAAFAVLACHFRGAFFVEYGHLSPEQQTPSMFAFYAITRLGHQAVLVFFVLSGFLVGGKALERIHNGTFKPRDYTIDRTVRIMLPLVSSLILAMIVNVIVGNGLCIERLIGNLFSLQGIICGPYFGTLWSLSYEVWFYIIFCAIGYTTMYKGSKRIGIGLFTLLICSLVFTKLNVCYLFVWLIGAFGYFMLGKRSKWLMLLSMILSLSIAGLLLLTSSSNTSIALTSFTFSREVLELTFGFVVCLFIVQLIQFPPTKNLGQKINSAGTKLAAFSYTLYLTHIPLRDLLTYLGAPKCQAVNIESIGLYCCWVLLAMGLAYGVYWLFERNTSFVKKWIKSRIF